MPSQWQIPQTPSAKTQFDSRFDDLPLDPISGPDRPVSESSLPRLAPSSADWTARDKEIAESRRNKDKTAASFRAHQLRPPDAYHRLSIGSVSDAGYGPSVLPSVYQAEYAVPEEPEESEESKEPEPPSRAHALVRRFWNRNRAVFFVFFAQLFGALMNLFARLLELDSDGHALHPVQLLFLRMIITTGASCLCMWYYQVADFPLGPRSVRWLLIPRGLFGFFGIFGMWYSMMYLPLAEATVFTFLSPSVTGYLCHVLLKDPFTRRERIASAVAFSGIVLITRPLSLIPHAAAVDNLDAMASAMHTNTTAAASTLTSMTSSTVTTAVAMVRAVAADAGRQIQIAQADTDEGVSVLHRLAAVVVALAGVLGGSCALTCIRAIGTRAHPLISVNYFTTWCTIVSGSVLAFAPMLGVGQPYLQFALPHTLRQWLLLLLICVCGFCTQFLATKGLGLERSNRATAMVYTQMLFAAGFDRFVFGHEMSTTSVVGCGLVIGSALWTALGKKPPAVRGVATAAAAPAYDSEVGLVSHHPLTLRDTAREPSVEGVPMLAAEDEDEVELDRTPLDSVTR